MKEKYSKKQEGPKGTGVEIGAAQYISEGSRGVAFQTEVIIGSKNRIFVLKKFFYKEDAKMALENYQRAKKAGLKVFTTYRIDETSKKILMTTGHTDTDVCLGSINHGNSLEYFNFPTIKTISNFDQFIEKYFTQAKIAANAGIEIWQDTPFFFVKKNTENSPLDFVLGDMDTL
ncbi:MAG: hypothetical protein HY225_00240 [Candidatus Vogelbacteria bacterium]|nr:hypothetical protein [Candidatus Vogelbacteria bacterium]